MANKVAVLIMHGIGSQKGRFTDATIVEQVKVCIKNLYNNQLNQKFYLLILIAYANVNSFNFLGESLNDADDAHSTSLISKFM